MCIKYYKKYKCIKSIRGFIKNKSYNGNEYSYNGKDINGFIIYNEKINKYFNEFTLSDFFNKDIFNEHFIDVVESRKNKLNKLINNRI